MENNEQFNDEKLLLIKKQIGEKIRQYKKLKKMSTRTITNYYRTKGIEDFDIGGGQYQRILNDYSNYQIDSLLKFLSILNLEIVIRPKGEHDNG